jgi:hypothetical protein
MLVLFASAETKDTKLFHKVVRSLRSLQNYQFRVDGQPSEKIYERFPFIKKSSIRNPAGFIAAFLTAK